jgi:mannose-6-phosphate isomerase
MWYVLQAEEGSELIVGFNRKLDKETYLNHLNKKTLSEILNNEQVKEGDVFFLPAGRVHAIGAGILLAEIQQSSDVTYRIYDFDRKESNGNYRELHTQQALDAIDYSFYPNYRTNYKENNNLPVKLVSCAYFTTNLLNLTTKIEKDIIVLDCFVIYLCLEGSCYFHYNDGEKVGLTKGESLLIPAELTLFSIDPDQSVKLLEVYITKTINADSKE